MPRQRFSRPKPFKSESKPAKWMGQWFVYQRQADGTERKIHKGPLVLGRCSEMSKSEAQDELDRRISESRAAADQVPRAGHTFDSYYRAYYGAKAPTWSKANERSVSYLFDSFVLPQIGKQTLKEITKFELQAILNAMATREWSDRAGHTVIGMSKSAIAKVRIYLTAIFEEAVEDDLLVKSPARRLELPRVDRKKCTRYLSDEECTKLLAAVHGRDHLILRIMIVCGLRPGELVALRRDDVEPGRLRIDETYFEGALRDYAKTQESIGYVAVPPSLQVELNAWLGENPGDSRAFLFPSKTNSCIQPSNYLRRALKPAGERAGIGREINFQALRRTTATHAQKTGSVKDVQAMMRHANPQTTAEWYMQELPDSVRDAVAALDQKLCGGMIQ